jgi:tetratricopeptide (TPR) repeat protein
VPRTARTPFEGETERKGHFLVDMSREEVKSYHFSIVADLWKERQQFEKAIECYRKAIEGRPYSATPRNNLAWMIATQPNLQRRDFLDHALTMAHSAVELRPKDGNFIDTLAAVHAARHEFDEAIAVEKTGRNNPSRIRAYLDRKTPVEMDWKLEPDQ